MGLVVHMNNRRLSSSYEVETKGDAQTVPTEHRA